MMPDGLDVTSTAVGFAAAPLLYMAAKMFLDPNRVTADAKPRSEPLKVVITGSTKCLGLALAESFLQLGDSVVISSRDAARCEAAVADLRSRFPNSTIRSFPADISCCEQAENLAQFAAAELQRVDIWVNNAGASQPAKGDITSTDPAVMQEVVSTNLLGSIYGSRAAMRVMAHQEPPGGKIFLMDGQGADGKATPHNAAYGATKAALVQLKNHLAGAERRASAFASLAAHVQGTATSVHLISPGMVATDLLAASAASTSPTGRKFLNVLAEEPRTVAQWLVPRMRGVTGNGKYFRYLTPSSALWKIATGWRSRRGRFYPESAKLS